MRYFVLCSLLMLTGFTIIGMDSNAEIVTKYKHENYKKDKPVFTDVVEETHDIDIKKVSSIYYLNQCEEGSIEIICGNKYNELMKVFITKKTNKIQKIFPRTKIHSSSDRVAILFDGDTGYLNEFVIDCRIIMGEKAFDRMAIEACLRAIVYEKNKR